MATLEERVAYLEGRVQEQSDGIAGVREAVVSMELRLDRRFEQLEGRIDARFEQFEQRMDARFAAIDRRFEAIDRRFESVDLRLNGFDVRLIALDVKIDQRFGELSDDIKQVDQRLDAKLSRQFAWLVGIQVTLFVAIVAALLAR